MRKGLRRLISAIIAWFIFAVTYPEVILQGRVQAALFTRILCVSAIPFLLVCIFVGRSNLGGEIR
jgi:hypothetical protein